MYPCLFMYFHPAIRRFYDEGSNGDFLYGGADYEIFLYDGTTETTPQVTVNSYDDRNPQINNAGYLVWDGTAGSGCFISAACGFRMAR
ncbi:MAG: hypothetical protein RQ760_18735 [Sedimentisphaerales bacterium]|nr:hypothetical protein [Sedimentisphaerales bacterium]